MEFEKDDDNSTDIIKKARRAPKGARTHLGIPVETMCFYSVYCDVLDVYCALCIVVCIVLCIAFVLFVSFVPLVFFVLVSLV